MKIALFYHSLVSDWNHGNAHFLRGIATELLERGHEVLIFEPYNGWSYRSLVDEFGMEPVDLFQKTYPRLTSRHYLDLDLEAELEGVELILVHEWNDHDLVRKLGLYRKEQPHVRLFFHDTHHRALTSEEEMAAYDLSEYDGVLAYGKVLRDLYLDRSWAKTAWTWHEAADVRVFRPLAEEEPQGDLVWIGNWGDGERTKELYEYLIEPTQSLRLRTNVYGVRYPREAQELLRRSGIIYNGWLPNFLAPQTFAQHRVTVHVPRRPYATVLPGIPTIRPFEALACGIPLISAPWEDVEQLFTPGSDFLVAKSGREMRARLQDLMHDEAAAAVLAKHGHATILAKHTCAHRVDELMNIYQSTLPTNAPGVSEEAAYKGISPPVTP